VPSDERDRHDPYPMYSASTLTPTPAPAKPDRAPYEVLRGAGLDQICLIDIKRRQLLVLLLPLGIHEINHLWDDEAVWPGKEEYFKVESEL
jgi:hypothetical protein